MSAENRFSADMAHDEQQRDEAQRWTVRGVGGPERAAAVSAAGRADISLGAWLTLAIRTRLQHENQQSKALVPADTPTSPAVTTETMAERVAASLAALSAAGATVPPVHVRRATLALVRLLADRNPKPVTERGEGAVANGRDSERAERA